MSCITLVETGSGPGKWQNSGNIPTICIPELASITSKYIIHHDGICNAGEVFFVEILFPVSRIIASIPIVDINQDYEFHDNIAYCNAGEYDVHYQITDGGQIIFADIQYKVIVCPLVITQNDAIQCLCLDNTTVTQDSGQLFYQIGFKENEFFPAHIMLSLGSCVSCENLNQILINTYVYIINYLNDGIPVQFNNELSIIALKTDYPIDITIYSLLRYDGAQQLFIFDDTATECKKQIILNKTDIRLCGSFQSTCPGFLTIDENNDESGKILSAEYIDYLSGGSVGECPIILSEEILVKYIFTPDAECCSSHQTTVGCIAALNPQCLSPPCLNEFLFPVQEMCNNPIQPLTIEFSECTANSEIVCVQEEPLYQVMGLSTIKVFNPNDVVIEQDITIEIRKNGNIIKTNVLHISIDPQTEQTHSFPFVTIADPGLNIFNTSIVNKNIDCTVKLFLAPIRYNPCVKPCPPIVNPNCCKK